MGISERISVVRTLAAYLSRLGISLDPAENNDLMDIGKKLKEGTLSSSDELRLDQILAQLSAKIAPKMINDIVPQVSRFRSFVSLLGTRRTWVASTVNIIGILLALAIIPLTTEFSIISNSVDTIRKVKIATYFNTIDEMIPLLEKKINLPDKFTSDDMSKWSLNLQTIRETDAELSSSTIEFSEIFDQTTMTPNWCALFFHLYGRDRWCATAKPIAGFADASTEADPAVQQLNVERNKLASYLGISFSSPFQSQAIGLEVDGGGDLALVLGNSILPLLYGLLGSVVFIMRQLFGEGENVFGSVISGTGESKLLFGRVVLRICLGGVAGLAIGWFWTAQSTKQFTEATTFSTAPFAIAFLAGFSIEVLFSILDRIISAINPRVAETRPGPASANG
jgi:hypothetical protein